MISNVGYWDSSQMWRQPSVCLQSSTWLTALQDSLQDRSISFCFEQYTQL
jgi:hypothetical protein